MSWVDALRTRLGLGGGAGATPLAELRFTALDAEMTGLDPRRDDLVALGALHLQGGWIEVGGAFEALVKPRAVLDGQTVVIHRITPEELEAMPPIEAVLGAFRAYAEGTVLLGHCLSLDLAFLQRDAKRHRVAPFRMPAVDTLSLYGWLRRREPDHAAFRLPLEGLSLFTLAQAFEIPVDSAHSALGDAALTAQLYQRLLPFLTEAGIQDLAGLQRVGDPKRAVDSLARHEGHPQF